MKPIHSMHAYNYIPNPSPAPNIIPNTQYLSYQQLNSNMNINYRVNNHNPIQQNTYYPLNSPIKYPIPQASTNFPLNSPNKNYSFQPLISMNSSKQYNFYQPKLNYPENHQKANYVSTTINSSPHKNGHQKTMSVELNPKNSTIFTSPRTIAYPENDKTTNKFLSNDFLTTMVSSPQKTHQKTQSIQINPQNATRIFTSPKTNVHRKNLSFQINSPIQVTNVHINSPLQNTSFHINPPVQNTGFHINPMKNIEFQTQIPNNLTSPLRNVNAHQRVMSYDSGWKVAPQILISNQEKGKSLLRLIKEKNNKMIGLINSERFSLVKPEDNIEEIYSKYKKK